MDNIKPELRPPLVLAYIGDGVYDLYVRNRIINEHPDMPPYKLHALTSSYVKAHAQSNSMKVIEPILSENELSVYKRGRNAKSQTVPKHADMADYRRSTGFEALIGYLYLKNEDKRLDELMKLAWENSQDKDL